MNRALLTTLVVIAVSACTNEVCKPYVLPAGTDLSTPAVTFRADIMPVLAASCASCHGAPESAPLGVVLGADADQARASLLAPPQKGYALPYVAPGDPSGSMITHMLDWDSSCTAACQSAHCGDDMPYGGPQISDDDRMKVRRWIAQGAKDD